MQIRPMELEDIEQVVHLENKTWNSLNTPAVLPIASKEKILKQFENQTHFLVAEDNDHIVGVLDYQPNYPFPSGHHVVTFGIAVASNKQGMGIGKQLILHFLERAKIDGYRKVSIHVLSTNNSAATFYEKVGFRLEARLTSQFYIDSRYVDDLIYSYDLEGNHA